MTTVMLYSGGADSLALWYRCGRPHGYYVSIGAKYQSNELTAIEKQQDVLSDLQVSVLPGPLIGPMEAVGGRIPLRNLTLISTVAAYTEASVIVVGFLKGEASPDKSRAFLRKLSAALSESEARHIEVRAPFLHKTKTEVLTWLRKTHPEAPLLLTVSCYSGNGKPCGDCPACFRGDVAKYLSGWSDKRPTMPSNRAALWPSLRDAGVARWPALARNNLDALRALRGRR